MGYDGSLKFDTEISEKGFNKGIKNLGNIAQGGLKVLAGSVAGIAAGFGVMTKSALDSFASLEQNIGGVETLFKDSAQKVIDSAENAYKTAGLSANAYTETVTSFSASLLQSLGKDTEKAADYADRAIIDMSDNANKMGTSMEMIQNAYQGFAKQNYTMLDNLKLGYGGTASEMYRLLQDAANLNEEFASTAKFSMDSKGHLEANFADITEAIHIVQTEMGITGTTAKEASETISGSIASAKGAFDNFLNGTGSPEALAESMVTAGKNVLRGLGEIVPRLLQTLPEVGKLIQENLVNSLSGDSMQKIVEAGKNAVMSLIDGMLASVPTIIPVALNFVKLIADTVITNVPTLIQKGYELLSNLVDGFVKAIPEALPKILDFVQGIGDKLAEAAPILIQKGFELLQKLVEGIITAVPILISRVPEIISTFANIINDNFPTILMKGAQLLGQLVLGLIQSIPTLIANIPKIISAIVDTLMAFQWLNLGRGIIKFLGDGIGAMKDFVVKKGFEILIGLKNTLMNLPSTLANIGRTAVSGLGNAISAGISWVKNAAGNIVSAIVNTIKSIPGGMLSIGKDIVKGLWNGISDMTGWVIDKIQGFGESVLGGIKDFFGIHSPSRVMRDEVGKYMAQGVGVGFEKNIPIKQMTAGMKKAIGKIQTAAIGVTSTMPMTAKVATKAVTNNYTDTQIDYKKIKKAQLEANNESNERPVILNGRQVNRALKDGGYVLA
ncbi:phage tail protein [Coprococcus sp. LG100-32]|uniref:phage tail protein n=1 Tax=Coprococcus sp. LG100-32 TaxID=2997994 RepID=UPI0022E1106B|nr:phage tail protein [Coprococcus sp. LG100-32]